jgi:hypothetical protein
MFPESSVIKKSMKPFNPAEMIRIVNNCIGDTVTSGTENIHE